MEPNPMEPQRASTKIVPAVIAGVVIAALVTGSGVYVYEKSQNDTIKASLQSQIDTLKTQVVSKPTLTSTPTSTTSPLATATPTSADPTANWKTYTDTNTGLSFKYPSTLTPNADTQAKRVGLSFYVSVQALNKIPDATLWYGPDAAKAEMAALTKGDLSQTHNADKLLTLNGGAVGATNLVFGELSTDSVMFLREAHIYRNNYQILIGLNDQNVDTIKANNPKYFSTNATCTGSDLGCKVWSTSTSSDFGNDVAAGKTDAESQNWYTTFQQILSTIKFK